MYLHTGENILISTEEILYIMPFDDFFVSANKECMEKNNLGEFSRNSKIRSLIFCRGGKVYPSVINARTLRKRFESFIG